MSVVHVSEQEAIRDFAAVLARLDAGDEVTIDRDGQHTPVRITRAQQSDALRASDDQLEHLSEFRQRHPEPLDSSRWD